MKKRALLMLILALAAAILTSCFGGAVESESSSSAETSNTKAYDPKDAYKEYGGIIDLKANKDLSKTAYCVNDRDVFRVVVSDGTSDITAYTSSRKLLYGTQWSPDGRYVSFYERSLIMNRRLFICDTSTWKVIDTGVDGIGGRGGFYGTNNIWSADSTKVLITSETGGGYYDLAAGKFVKIGQTSADFFDPSFSPDGSMIVYDDRTDMNHPVPFYVYDIASGKSREVCTLEITPPSGIAASFFPPVWVSNTEFLENKFTEKMIVKIDIATGEISDYIADASFAVYLSPNGKHLVYQRRSDSKTVIKSIASGTETVIQYSKQGTHPVWSYDSQKVLLCDYESVAVFGLDGKQVGEVMTIPKQYIGGGSDVSFSTPVYTKDGLWYEGKES